MNTLTYIKKKNKPESLPKNIPQTNTQGQVVTPSDSIKQEK